MNQFKIVARVMCTYIRVLKGDAILILIRTTLMNTNEKWHNYNKNAYLFTKLNHKAIYITKRIMHTTIIHFIIYTV